MQRAGLVDSCQPGQIRQAVRTGERTCAVPSSIQVAACVRPVHPVAAVLLRPERAPGRCLSQPHLSCGLWDRYAERGVAVQDGGADLQFCDLTIEVACHQALTRQFQAMHRRLGAVSAIVHSIFVRVRVRGISRRFAPRSARWRLRSMASMVWRSCAGEAPPGIDPVDHFSPERTEPWGMTGSASRSATASWQLRVSQAPSAVTVSSSSSAGIRSRSSGGIRVPRCCSR